MWAPVVHSRLWLLPYNIVIWLVGFYSTTSSLRDVHNFRRRLRNLVEQASTMCFALLGMIST